MDEQCRATPSNKTLIIPVVILAVIGISILTLTVVFFLSLQDTVYPLPIGPIMETQTEDASVPSSITPVPVKFPAETLLVTASRWRPQMS
jgi:hypothetical protein